MTCGRDLLVHGLRSLERQRPLVGAGLVRQRSVGGGAVEHRPRRRQAGRGQRIDRPGDLRQAGDRRVLAGRRDGLLGRRLVDVGEAHPLHRVEVIEVAPELLEAVRGRQRLGVVAEVVLAELAGVVAEIVQELGERRRAGPQVGRASGNFRQGHADAQRIHAGEEGGAPGGAALLGVVVGEHRAFFADAVDVRRLADHQAAVVDRRLHPADVVAHDEEDVGLLRGLLRRRRARRRRRGRRRGRKALPSVVGAYSPGRLFASLHLLLPAVSTWSTMKRLGRLARPCQVSSLWLRLARAASR